MPPAAAAIPRDRIGPNAIIQVVHAVSARFGYGATQRLFSAAGLASHLAHLPHDMVSERDVALLQHQLRDTFGATVAKEVSWDAGLRTGDYLLAHRIPRLAQIILKRLPASVAARVLATAIGKHSWTFAGSGTFHVQRGMPFVFSIRGNPICSAIKSDVPVCDYYAATFEQIFRAIVHRDARVTEVACESTGAPACVFEIRW
jgi:divinyl protochlorophyllide a 8-vinyl-reductase